MIIHACGVLFEIDETETASIVRGDFDEREAHIVEAVRVRRHRTVGRRLGGSFGTSHRPLLG